MTGLVAVCLGVLLAEQPTDPMAVSSLAAHQVQGSSSVPGALAGRPRFRLVVLYEALILSSFDLLGGLYHDRIPCQSERSTLSISHAAACGAYLAVL